MGTTTGEETPTGAPILADSPRLEAADIAGLTRLRKEDAIFGFPWHFPFFGLPMMLSEVETRPWPN